MSGVFELVFTLCQGSTQDILRGIHRAILHGLGILSSGTNPPGVAPKIRA
jgi:hypothetical protein